MNIELDANEIVDIIKVLGNLPTETNAWPLRAKIIAQYEAQKPADEPSEAASAE